jgi:hypothetical protein
MSDKTAVNKAYQNGYADGYRRGAKSKSVEHMYGNPIYMPYLPVTYYTGVIMMLALFLIFIIILSYINRRPVGYITKYDGDCLLKLSSTYSAIECL